MWMNSNAKNRMSRPKPSPDSHPLLPQVRETRTPSPCFPMQPRILIIG
jgi:hypothetical protein